jgi:hypothetical protein
VVASSSDLFTELFNGLHYCVVCVITSLPGLAIYAAPTPYGDVVKFIMAVDLERAMRQTASKVYKLDPITDRDALQR